MKIIENNNGTYTRQWRCVCGAKIETHSDEGGHDTECRCGRLFNCFGQQLQNPANWHDDY
jgi:hypothetical protein